MAGSEASKSVETPFHGVPYVITWRSGNDVLVIDIEHDESERRWHAEFQASYIEDLTKKTGNFKKFDVFVRMLSKALEKPNNNVFADLLTVKDLEMLKSRKSAVSSKSRSRRAPNEKRYLIVTYVAAFDRVHYPLPLPVWNNPSPEMLQRTIRRLLRDKTQEPRASPSGDTAKTTITRLQRQLEAVTAQRDNALAHSQQANAKVQEWENRETHNAQSDHETIKILKSQVESLELALEDATKSHRRIQGRRKKELETSLEEVRKLREVNRELRSKIRQGAGKTAPPRRSRSRTAKLSKPRYSRSKPRVERETSTSKKRQPRTSSLNKRKPRARSFKRFDPSAYQRQREKRLSISRRRRNLRKTTGLSDRSFDSNRSRSRLGRSSIDSGYTSGESQASGRSRRSVESTVSRSSNRSKKKGRSSLKKPGNLPSTVRRKPSRSPKFKENRHCEDPLLNAKVAKQSADASTLAFSESTNKQMKNSSTAALELSDIDGRLNALQNFLKAAKSSTR